jgi:hypothetical protein
MLLGGSCGSAQARQFVPEPAISRKPHPAGATRRREQHRDGDVALFSKSATKAACLCLAIGLPLTGPVRRRIGGHIRNSDATLSAHLSRVRMPRRGSSAVSVQHRENGDAVPYWTLCGGRHSAKSTRRSILIRQPTRQAPPITHLSIHRPSTELLSTLSQPPR